MKIDEPKTPYHHDSFDDSIEYDGDADMGEEYGAFSHNFTRAPPHNEKSHSLMENWDELHDAMQKVKEKQEKKQENIKVEKKKTTTSDKKVNLESDEERDKSSGSESESKHKFKYHKKDEFVSKRKAHYNEFLALRAFREKGLSDDDENFLDQKHHGEVYSPEKPEKPEKSEKPEKPAKPEKSEKPTKSEKGDYMQESSE